VPNTDHSGFSVALNWKQVVFFVLAASSMVMPCLAQKQGIGAAVAGYRRTGKFPERVYSSTLDTSAPADEEQCFPWNLSKVRTTTVSVTKLKVPQKARDEYAKACDASNKNKFEEAEQHARGAIEKFQDYSAAWVLLGVILEEQNKGQEAHDACARATAIDATYLPAYLCAAELSVRDRKWQSVLDSADVAVSLNLEGDSYSRYYRATAYFHMNNLAEAKKSALQAAEMNVEHDEPSLYFLLAKIYEREGDNASAIAQLEQLLKHPADRQRQDAARQLLAKLESQPPAK